MIYELRIDRCVPGRMPALLSRFENETLRIWEKHGICQAGFWTTLIGKSSQEITYAKGRFQHGIVFAAAASGRDALYYHFWVLGVGAGAGAAAPDSLTSRRPSELRDMPARPPVVWA